VEGHTAFANKEEAEKEIKDIMALWKDTCEDYLALYGIHGRKTEKEKFAGAEYTESFEYFVPNGRMAQGPDAHYDGQNFAKAYDITFLDDEGKSNYVFQNTWALSTRMIGILVAMHGDDKGLVVPPKLAPNKAVIVPILFEDTKKDVLSACQKLNKELEAFDPILDDRDGYSPGWKFNEWELKGIPVRIELGPKDLKAKQAVLVRRDNREKKIVPLKDVRKTVTEMLENMQKSLLTKSKKLTEASIVDVKSLSELVKAIKNKKCGRGPFCGEPSCEDKLKANAEGATTRGSPKDSKLPKGKCINCGKTAKVIVLFAKAY